LPRLGIPAPSRGVGEDIWDRLWLNYVGRGVEFGYTSQGRDVRLGDDTRVYDENWNLIQNTRDHGGLGVWIPVAQIVSIEIYDPAPNATAAGC